MTEDLHQNPEAAAEMAANAVISYLRSSGVKGEQALKWIQDVFALVTSKLAH